jgi:hypothetical protein
VSAGAVRPPRQIDCRRHTDPRSARAYSRRRVRRGEPAKDLLLSPDHAVQVDDALIPIRLLLNGSTIRQDDDVAEIDYYHVELDRHDVLFAEGLAAESYVDTGNRGLFANSDAALTLHANMMAVGGQALRERMSCLRLRCDPARLEAVWHRLRARAGQLGFVPCMAETSDEPVLRIASDGRLLAPVARDGRCYTFVVSSGTDSLRLRSRFAIPSDVRPWIDDHRQLRVMVRRIMLRHGTDAMQVAMDDPGLSDGWWAVEGDGGVVWRWTDCDAILPSLGEGPAMIEVLIGAAGPYPLEVDTETLLGNAA